MKWRLFLTCWIIYVIHFATDFVREHYLVVSIAEDMIATLASLIAIFLPALVLVVLALFAVSSILLLRRFRRPRTGDG